MTHITRSGKEGDLTAPLNAPLHTPEMVARFFGKVQQGPGCWQWTGNRNPKGYGRFPFGGKTFQAHRVAYSLAGKPLNNLVQLDHLCRNRACVNPAHLEPVTNKENVLRGTGFAAINAKKTHCPHGHEYSPENTTTVEGKGHSWRICKTCRSLRAAAIYRADPEKARSRIRERRALALARSS